VGCVPTPKFGFESAVCVQRAGQHACPQGYPTRLYVVRHIRTTRAAS
jgi:hypothetical protein